MTSKPDVHRSKQHIVRDIEALTRQPEFLHTLIFLCYRDLFVVDLEEAANRNWRASLSYQELGLLCGLLVKHTLQTAYASPDVVALQVSRVDALFKELHDAYCPPMINSKSLTSTVQTSSGQPLPTSSSYGMGDFFAEAIFYAGAGAYDFQYFDLAAKRYKADDQWIVQHRRFSIDAACAIARQLKSLIEARLKERMLRESFTDSCDQLLRVFSFEARDIMGVPSATIDAFLESFSLEPGTVNPEFNIYGDYNAFEARPIIRLGDGHYLLLVYFWLAQSIYESPFYWMNDDHAYRDTASANRGKATTSMAYEMMARVFGPTRVFHDVRVMRNRREAVTDIDVLAFVGNKAIVVQAKSKKLTQLARRGSENSLRADFKAAIQDGYNQATACRRALLDSRHTFVDNRGKQLRLEEPFDDVYLVCLTSDNYPGLSLQTAHLLVRTADNPPPIAISLSDLDVLRFYLNDPFDFVYYLRQRAATDDHFIAENEIVLLAHHLRQPLCRNPDYDIQQIEASCAQWIDADFPAAHSHVPTDPSVTRFNRGKDDAFTLLLDQLKGICVPGCTDAVFMLYELRSESADQLVKLIKSTKLKTARDGQRHSISLTLGDDNERGISFICRLEKEILSQDVLTLGTLNKYKFRAKEWLSLGSISGSTKMIDMAMFTKKPWKLDPKLDALSRRLRPKMVMSGSGKVGRNAPCPCGSQLKFKKCCGL